MKRWLLAAACGIAALGLMLYPLVGELLSEKYHSDIETVYTAAIENTDDTELTAQRQAAEQYNAMLSGQAAITEGGASTPPLAYAEQLTVGCVMAYVDIPKIGVYLPVQHGTDADTLERAVGHVVGTSLPVGGSTTHAVLSAHSGLASSKLFSDIDQLAVGDTFYIHVLGDTLAYKVDAIHSLYAMIYDLRTLLVLGRVASGIGGNLIIEECQRVLEEEFPELCRKLRVMLPDEKFRRVGQSMAAASLPEV